MYLQCKCVCANICKCISKLFWDGSDGEQYFFVNNIGIEDSLINTLQSIRWIIIIDELSSHLLHMMKWNVFHAHHLAIYHASQWHDTHDLFKPLLCGLLVYACILGDILSLRLVEYCQCVGIYRVESWHEIVFFGVGKGDLIMEVGNHVGSGGGDMEVGREIWEKRKKREEVH